jgi:hypothetical protein
MNQTDKTNKNTTDFLGYANRCMDSYESSSWPCEDRLILAKISLRDHLQTQDAETEFDKTLLRLINLHRTNPIPVERD